MRSIIIFSGNFSEAKRHAEKSLSIMGKHLPSDHLFLASSKRVLALILEEIAIDNSHSQDETLLVQSEELHLFALNLARLNFGECNVQTAKHYGNLGRLYQVSYNHLFNFNIINCFFADDVKVR